MILTRVYCAWFLAVLRRTVWASVTQGPPLPQRCLCPTPPSSEQEREGDREKDGLAQYSEQINVVIDPGRGDKYRRSERVMIG